MVSLKKNAHRWQLVTEMLKTKAGKTRSRILEAARTLFNEQGERVVTTNHIATHLGISPGNLYYHFRNKNQMVLALLQNYASSVREYMDKIPENSEFTIDDKRCLLEETCKTIWHYRFLYRDVALISCEDAELREEFVCMSSDVVAGIKDIYRRMIASDMMSIEDSDLEALIHNNWLVLISWVSSLGALLLNGEREMTQRTVRRAIYQMLMLDRAFITPAHKADFDQLASEYLS